MAKIDQALIHQILQLIGGSSNVKQCGHCMTRLRLALHDNQRVDQTAIKLIDGVLGVVSSNEQFQIILGPGKAQTASELMNTVLQESTPTLNKSDEGANLADIANDQKSKLKSTQTNPIQKFMATFATIFTPLISGFIAAGLLLGIATLMEQTLLIYTDHNQLLVDLIAFMKLFSKGLISFLSILVGYNAQKAFGGSGVNGAIIASLFVLGYDPSIKTFYSGMSDFFGIAIDPRGSIVGVLIASIIGAYVERFIRKLIPDNLDMILTSTFTLIVMGAFTFVIIMPAAAHLFEMMSYLFQHLNGNPFGSALLAGLFLISVMFGIHQGFVPVYLALVSAQGFNSLFPILAMAGAGQVGAALGLYVRAIKGSILRKQISGAIIPGILGIGEPLIYGVTLPRVKPFITACLGGAMGGFFIGLVASLGLPMGLNSAFGPSGIVALPLMTSHLGVLPAMSVYAVGLLIAYLSGFVLTYLWGSKGVDLD